MTSETVFVLERGLWDGTSVIGTFASLSEAEAEIEKLVGETKKRHVGNVITYTCPVKAAKWFPDWFRVTVSGQVGEEE